MKTFVYMLNYAKNNKPSGGRRVVVTVYRIKSNKPIYIGFEVCDSAAWYGERSTANRIISRETGMRMADSYELLTNNVRVIEMEVTK